MSGYCGCAGTVLRWKNTEIMVEELQLQQEQQPVCCMMFHLTDMGLI